jgi:hypothetical protein
MVYLNIQTFRTPTTAAPGFAQDAAKFFSPQAPSLDAQRPARPFDLSAMHHTLPLAASSASMTASAPLKVSNWAADFLTQEPTSMASPVVQSPSHSGVIQVASPTLNQGNSFFQPRYAQNFQSMPSMHAGSVPQIQQAHHGKHS